LAATDSSTLGVFLTLKWKEGRKEGRKEKKEKTKKQSIEE
jgi:hypothetical protein